MGRLIDAAKPSAAAERVRRCLRISWARSRDEVALQAHQVIEQPCAVHEVAVDPRQPPVLQDAVATYTPRQLDLMPTT
jgi:hypothetical protein